MPHAFVSYVRQNKRLVTRLYEDLKAGGAELWLDKKNLKPGQPWQTMIRRAISDGAFFLACFTPAYAKKQRSYMETELKLAIAELQRRKHDAPFFIPIILAKTKIPDNPIGAGQTLQDLHFVDLSGRKWREGISELLKLLVPESGLYEPRGDDFLFAPEREPPVTGKPKRVRRGPPRLPKLQLKLERLEAELMKENSNILRLAYDRRIRAGKQDEREWCIRVYVRKKIPQSKVRTSLPDYINGLPVDVVEFDWVKFLN